MAKHTENGFSIHAPNAVSPKIYSSSEYENASNTERTNGFTPGDPIKVVNVNTGLKETTSFATAYLDAMMDLCDTLQASPKLYDSFLIEDDFETAKDKFKTIMSNLLEKTIANQSEQIFNNMSTYINMENKQLKGLDTPILDDEAANKKYVDDVASEKQDILYMYKTLIDIKSSGSEWYLVFDVFTADSTPISTLSDMFNFLKNMYVNTKVPMTISGYYYSSSGTWPLVGAYIDFDSQRSEVVLTVTGRTTNGLQDYYILLEHANQYTVEEFVANQFTFAKPSA